MHLMNTQISSMNFLATHVMNIFGEFQVLVADIRAMQGLSEPLLHFNICSNSLNPLSPEQAPLKVNGFYVKFSSLIYLDRLGSLACLMSFCNELEQMHLRGDMKGLEVGCPDQISDTCDPICRLSKYPFVSTFYGAQLKVACGTGGTGSNEEIKKKLIM